MKILIVSDIHGNFECMKKVLQNNSSFDKMFILGDILYGTAFSEINPDQLALLLNLYKDKIIAVRGNCDYHIDDLEFSADKSFILYPADGHNFLLTHGHHFFPSHPPEGIDFDVFLSGHSHVASLERIGDKLYLNPGSISHPRRGVKSYIFYEDGEFQLKDVENNEILEKIK